MPLITLYSTEKGIKRMMTAMFDLDVYGDWAGHDRKLGKSAGAFQELFGNYQVLLKGAYDEAVPWWENTILAQRGLGLNEEEAVQSAFNSRLAGAASDPRVVWIIRLFWLSCVDLNSRLADAEKVRPEVFLLQWLIDAGEDELVRLVACMPYWPIGLDADGNWC